MQLVDTDRYPIEQAETSAYRSLLADCRRELGSTGALALPGFVHRGAVDAMIEEVTATRHLGHRMIGEFTPYSDNLSEVDDATLPRGHPRTFRLPASHRFVAGDCIDPASPLRLIYRESALTRFAADALELDTLFTVADPMGCLNYLIYEPGDCNGWHFDSTDFIVSLFLQATERGGDYHYIPELRTPDDENLQAVADRMRDPDRREGVLSAQLEPGTLFLFKGRNTLHRVTTVEGSRERIVAILSYHQASGRMLSEGSKLAMYGRTN